MGRLRDKLASQHNTGRLWGRFALAGSQIAVFVSGYTFFMVSLNAYEPVSAWFAEHGMNVPFWLFILVVLLPILIAYLLAWKFLVVSFYTSWTEQFWKQNNPLDKIEKQMDEGFKEMGERLKRLEEKAGIETDD